MTRASGGKVCSDDCLMSQSVVLSYKYILNKAVATPLNQSPVRTSSAMFMNGLDCWVNIIEECHNLSQESALSD